ncbi:MAG: glycoside hydrolase family 3 protein [Pricia sp.]
MSKVLPYQEASIKLSIQKKVGQLFMPAAFINDTEEEVQKLEKLIRQQGVGGVCFFHSRASAATNFEKDLLNASSANSVDSKSDELAASRREKPVVPKSEKSGDLKQEKSKLFQDRTSFERLRDLIDRYQKAARYSLLIAIDAEWGLAMRVENTPQYPYAITLGAIADDRSDLIFKVGRNIARDCRAAGIHWNLAPCVDINNNPRNPVIGYRSFGDDKRKVTEKALAFIKGTQSEGILISIKHFPGHGDTATDSHLELPLIDKSKKELLENELHPFQKLIDEKVDSVMVGHLSVPALSNGKNASEKILSSSLSKAVIKGVLREEMGYQGVVISDALNMHAVSKNYPVKGELEWIAFDAGNDVLCFAEHIEEGIETILKKASEAQIEESFERIWRLKEKVFGPTKTPVRIEASKNSALNPVLLNGGQKEDGGPIIQAFKHSDSLLQDPDNLNRELARESLTLLQGSEEAISDCRASDFMGISISHDIENHFFKSIKNNKPFKLISRDIDSGPNKKNILLALFPPQVKPTHNFGLSNHELIFINELVQTKNVTLYLFGNPYVLNHIAFQKARAVVLAYQNFKAFQTMAADHFLGNFQAKGKLPIEIAPKK